MSPHVNSVHALFETGLFESPLREDYRLKLLNSNFSLFLDHGSTLWWERYRRTNGKEDYRIVSFESVLSNVSSSLQKDLLFYLDILSFDIASFQA
jgi:hypothetical protein